MSFLSKPFHFTRRIKYYDDSAPRIFCLSMQRTGTSSVGKFLRDMGYDWAGWPHAERNHWIKQWYDGDFEKIFNSVDFRKANIFEDIPWWLPEFYKFIFHRFPNSQFILFTRHPDAWFQSMLSHSGGDVTYEERVHAKTYRREWEYHDLMASGQIRESAETSAKLSKVMKLKALGDHYKAIYLLHNMEVQDYFRRKAPNALFTGVLEDANKWIKLGRFLGKDVPSSYTAHLNASAG